MIQGAFARGIEEAVIVLGLSAADAVASGPVMVFATSAEVAEELQTNDHEVRKGRQVKNELALPKLIEGPFDE